jgi:hypothetical protein
MYKFALGHVPDYSHHHVTMAGCAWMESTASHVIAQTQAMTVSCVRTTLMIAKFPRARTALSAMMVLRTTIAVVLKAIQVCNRYLGAQLHLPIAQYFPYDFSEHHSTCSLPMQ